MLLVPDRQRYPDEGVGDGHSERRYELQPRLPLHHRCHSTQHGEMSNVDRQCDAANGLEESQTITSTRLTTASLRALQRPVGEPHEGAGNDKEGGACREEGQDRLPLGQGPRNPLKRCDGRCDCGSGETEGDTTLPRSRLVGEVVD